MAVVFVIQMTLGFAHHASKVTSTPQIFVFIVQSDAKPALPHLIAKHVTAAIHSEVTCATKYVHTLAVNVKRGDQQLVLPAMLATL